MSGDDHARLGNRSDELVRFEGNRAYMRMAEGHCAALRVQASSGEFVCSAYATRPQICRDLTRGLAACTAEIDAKSDRPRLVLLRARR